MVPSFTYLKCIYFLQQIKKTEKNIYKKKQSWPLQELKMVDGIDGNKVFHFYFICLITVRCNSWGSVQDGV